MFNTIKVNNTDTDYTHSIFDISGYNSGAIYANLSAALAAVPQNKKQGGMTVKFIQQITLAQYSVVKTEELETEPSGTLLSEAPYIDSGTYDENQLSTVFSTLPSETGDENALTYYVAVTVDETTTYTSWVITKVQTNVNKYMQYRLMSDTFNTTEANWQSLNVDDVPILGSNKLIKSGGAAKLTIKIVGFGTTGQNAGITGTGQVYYNTNDRKLKLCTGYTTVPTAFVDVSYFDGAVYTYNNLLYVWNGTDLVLGSKSVIGEADSTYGNTAIKYGTDKVADVILANKILRIKGIGANAGAISTTTWVKGEYMWSTTTHCIRKCTSVNSAGTATGFADIPSYIGALYSLDNKLYVCVGSDIVRVKQNISITKNDTTGYAKITIDDVEQSIPLATDINIALFDTKVVTLKGKAASAGDISTTDWHVGEYMWSTQIKKLRKCTNVNTSGAATGFNNYDGSVNAIYLYNGDIYTYDPSDLSLKVATSNIYAEINKTNNKVSALNISKIEVASVNLINPDAITPNKGITRNGVIATLSGGFLTDYIPVNGNDIISNAQFNATWGGAVYDANFVRVRVLLSVQYEYQEGDAFIRLTYGTLTPLSSARANYGQTLLPYSSYNPIDEYLEDVEKKFDDYAKDNLSIAIGNQKACGTYESELAASPVISDSTRLYISTKSIKKDKTTLDKNLNIVAVNHDDLPQSDYAAVTKIYNKYGFRASWCYINNAFASKELKQQQINGISRVINEGHEIGLHAILASSYWLFNKMFDVKPNGESNFAPLVSELRGEQPDGTGTNAFGRTITLNTKLTNIGYLEPHTNSKVVELTNEINAENNRFYTFYGDTTAVSGLDLDDVTVSKTRLQWLEYWYNNLVDDSIGYSSTESVLSDRFSEDYDYPNLYPDAEHILNGKMVHYDDVTNLHYNDADYQKVGKFTQGLFKDSYSTCNYEVMDRALAAVEAFARKYFGLNHFTDCHRHGVISAAVFWKDSSGLCYCNREKTVVDGGNGTFFHSRFRNFVKQIDIMQMFGIKQIVQDAFRNQLALQGQTGFFFGQNGRRNNLLNVVTDADSYGIVAFGSLFGTQDTEGQENMNYTRFHAFIDGINDWTKYFYENAGKSMTRGESTEYVFPVFKQCIDAIRSSKGTGKVPFISLDTIRVNPSSYTLVDLLCRYCKSNGYRMVPANEALETILSVDRNTGGNLFPNPTFEQSLVDYFGGESDSRDAYIPDGWRNNARDNGVYAVTTETVDSQEMQVLSIAPASTSNVNIYTKMYGLPVGKYRLTYYSKSTNETSTVRVYAIKNSNGIYEYGGSVDTYSPTSQWQKHTVDITINEPYQKVENTGTSKACDGYQDAIIAVRLLISVNSSDVVYFANPKMYAIPEGLN